MIKRAKTVKLLTGGYGCRITVENSKMTSEKLRRILEKHGGEEKEDYCWFETNTQYWAAIKELTDKGATKGEY